MQYKYFSKVNTKLVKVAPNRRKVISGEGVALLVRYVILDVQCVSYRGGYSRHIIVDVLIFRV